ncbi:MAG: GNAT family N-acetyltransferase [Chitinophaga sp.]|uniref:GNAT family N-acetyltransferase n=1 Tax=Chitinophaga sp. TaxID=1869181 RepID=UPI0025C2DAF1|nr:GNAT family N-acetyltransferase [Chitinophaga sp.]MBV8251852.1 GNAT family N-acetyltransferase [Chitinophaga sp.]
MEIIQANTSWVNEAGALFFEYRNFYRQEPDYEGAWQFMSDRINNQDSMIYLALEEGRAIGFVQLYPIFTSVGMKRAWMLNDLFVLEAHRGRGAGKLLVERSRQLAKDTDAKWMMLQTEITNTGAQKLYESLGFQKDNDFLTYYLSI